MADAKVRFLKVDAMLARACELFVAANLAHARWPGSLDAGDKTRAALGAISAARVALAQIIEAEK